MKRLNVFQDKLGLGWATWLGENFEDFKDLSKPIPIVAGQGMTIEESTKEFVKALDRAIRSGRISIFDGNVTLVDAKDN